MALRELSSGASGLLTRHCRPALRLCGPQSRRHASNVAAGADISELESMTSFDPSHYDPKEYKPLELSQGRRTRLPRSRYQYKPPKYYRGPLHPHQPPPPSDPASREFIPGPFSSPRLEQTYKSTFAQDIMALSYQHFPPGHVAPIKGERLRSWDESSPYHKGRPLRGPRGGDPLRPIRRPITFRNVPKLEGITVHSFVKEASAGSDALHVASMVLQAITGARAQVHEARKNVVQWGIRQGKAMSLTCDLRGEAAYHFLSKTVDVVLPRIKEWKGVRASSGDSSGNITFGLDPAIVQFYPEVEVNYDSYPPKMIPGCHITIKTSANGDRDARILCTAFGIPFHGKQVN